MSKDDSASVWSRLEEFSKKTYPDYVKESLSKCGYVTFDGMRMICAESITDMEKYLKTEFLPAHKHFILDVPRQIEEMGKMQKSHQKQKKTDSETPVRNQQKSNKEQNVKCKSNNSLQGFKSRLVDKVRKYVRSNDMGDENMTTDNVIGFKRCAANAKYLYECFFKCPFCDKSYSVKCNLTQFWDTTNVNKHLNRQHKKNMAESSSAEKISTESKVDPALFHYVNEMMMMHPPAGPSSAKNLNWSIFGNN